MNEVKQSEHNMRALGSREIEALVAAGCCSTDWNSVAVADDFEVTGIYNCQFEGWVELVGKSAIGNSTIRDCRIGAGCQISHVRLLSGYCVEGGCELRNIGEICSEGTLVAGQYPVAMPLVAAMNENGGREIGIFRGMTVGDAYMWAKYRSEGDAMEKFRTLAEKEAAEKPIGHIGAGCRISNCLSIKNVAVGECTVIANCISIVDGVTDRGCHIENGVIAQRFLLGENVRLENGLRLIDSVVGDNSTLACCEVVCSMIFPGHEQHHNNSFLIAATVKGQSNVAAGATIGSNHNSRSSDGEIVAGRGFWPGLCCSFKHSSKFASYCLLAKGDYPYELNIALPFALVNNNVAKNQLEVMPAYWWMYNMYAMKRNAVKYRQRDKRVGGRQHIEFEMFAPDTVEEIIAARKLIKIWTEEAYNPALMNVLPSEERQIEIVAQGMENSKRKTVLLKVGKAYKVYGEMLIYYAMSVLSDNGNNKKPQYNGKAFEREKRWHNIGGQLVADSDLKKLFDDLPAFTSWDEIHERMDELWTIYPNQKRQHAYQVLLDLLLADEITDDQWQCLLKRYAEICKEIDLQADTARRKDEDNEYRRLTFDTDEERSAVVKK